MAVDRGYGSGKPLSAAQSASRRAAAGKAASRKKTVTAAAKKYGQKKNMMYTNPGMLASQKKRMTLDNRRTSANALENLTGFNSRDGVDAGDLAGLAISIPTGGVGGALLRAGARAVIPKAVRIAGAAKRVAAKSSRASASLNASSEAIRSGVYASDDAARALRSPTYVGADYYDSTTKMVDGLFDKWETTAYRRGAGDTISAADRARQAAAGTGRRVVATQTQDFAGRATRYRIDPSAADLAESARLEASRGGAIDRAYQVGQAARAAESRSTTSAAAAEIKRRLAALRKAKEAQKKAPKVPRTPTTKDYETGNW